MQLRYDEDFIEAAVFLAANGRRPGVPSMQIARFHRERERLYHLLDPDERNTAFFRLHLEWFREWGMEAPITDALREFPILPKLLTALAVRKTHGRNDEGAELYVNDAGQRTGLLALRLENLSRNAALTDFLRHEFTHLHDMLDPEFGYSPTLELPGLNPAQQRLARERYRLLWDIAIDGRIQSKGNTPMATREQHIAAFSRGYSFWHVEKRTRVFDSLWHGEAPRHSNILALIEDPRGLRGSNLPQPGGSCPLCAFPTFAWADTAFLHAELRSRIAVDFPAWSPELGLCGRCLEIYAAVAGVDIRDRAASPAPLQ